MGALASRLPEDLVRAAAGFIEFVERRWAHWSDLGAVPAFVRATEPIRRNTPGQFVSFDAGVSRRVEAMPSCRSYEFGASRAPT